MNTNNPKDLPQLSLTDAMMVMDEEKSELDKVLELMQDPDFIQHYTELNKNEVLSFSVLSTVAARHPKLLLKDWLLENLKMRVSKGRKGRAEIVKLASRGLGANFNEMEIQGRGSGWRKWFGGGRK